MDIVKSSMHSKITGDFGEALVLYWLSKHNFECVRVDHTGIDLIAKNPSTQELMGISVKSRSRNLGKEHTSLNISNDNFVKAQAACDAFNCVPYFAIIIDRADIIHGFLLPMKRLVELFPPGKSSSSWKMRDKYLTLYDDDPEIKMFEFSQTSKRWW